MSDKLDCQIKGMI